MGLLDGFLGKVIDDSLNKPKRYKCLDCGKHFTVIIDLFVKCPKCGSTSVIKDPHIKMYVN